MKRAFLAAIAMFLGLALTGCGGGGNNTVTTQILSDPTFDGDIAQNSTSTTVTPVSSGVQSVFAGIDPSDVTGTEFRAFLDFPLSTIPLSASIVSASLDIYINSMQSLTGSVPISIELVSFSSLGVNDFNSTPLTATLITFPVFQTDVGQHVFVDVTSLMAEAQSLGLQNFQIRIALDFSAASSGLIEINDTTGQNRTALAPLLEVTYF